MKTHHSLTQKSCTPCKGDTPPLKGEKLSTLYSELEKGWQIVQDHHLEKEYLFPDFASALAFTNKVGAPAEQEGHHPDILLSYGKVKITLWTHKIDGLSDNDFFLASSATKFDIPLKINYLNIDKIENSC